jgi:hypothetical protein
VETPYGSVTFTVYGTPKPKRPAILTYHDVGLNCKTFIFSLFFWEEVGRRVETQSEERVSVGRWGNPCMSSGLTGITVRWWVVMWVCLHCLIPLLGQCGFSLDKSCFQPLFQFGDMQEIIQNFVRVHVDAPGMEEGAPVFPLG